MNHNKILISACLLGKKVRYDGLDSLCEHPILQLWRDENRLISTCPEMEGGLPTPRPASEIVGKGGGKAVIEGKAEVMTNEGVSNTDAYLKGAQKALDLAIKYQVAMVLLKARSPSCGNELISDGTFQGKKIPGMGTTAALLTQHGFKVFNEEQLDEAAIFLASKETR